MGWLPVLLSGSAAFLFFKTEHIVLMVIAIITAIACFWSWGVMHNYATEFAKRRPGYTGGFFDITNREAQAIPDWISVVNMIVSLLGLILLVIGIAFMIWR